MGPPLCNTLYFFPLSFFWNPVFGVSFSVSVYLSINQSGGGEASLLFLFNPSLTAKAGNCKTRALARGSRLEERGCSWGRIYIKLLLIHCLVPVHVPAHLSLAWGSRQHMLRAMRRSQRDRGVTPRKEAETLKNTTQHCCKGKISQTQFHLL